jgi:NADH-quinone oxidoreductase subunit F
MAEKLTSRETLLELAEKLAAERKQIKQTITLCAGTGCRASSCMKVHEALQEGVEKRSWGKKVEVRTSGCHGLCELGPLLVAQPGNIFYKAVKPEDVDAILDETIDKGEIVEKLLYEDRNTGDKIVHWHDIPFYKKQKRLVFGANGEINPNIIEDFFAVGGYQSLAKALTSMQPDEIVEQIKKSGLRGRGGGGFPTGLKWESCRKAHGATKYILCNADEGDPGAFMDRSILEGNPHCVIEGMLIAALAIGGSEGYVYVRNEYPLAVKNLSIALDQARQYGLLGENILGSGFNFDIKINRGGGAFVCGESTALMASMEGKPGEPRAKFVHTAEKGLWEKPTNLNNVETYANVPWIVENGADEYAAIGTEGSKGTKIFSLVGKVNNTGLIEVPMGITLREIVYDIGGGIPGNKKFKAVQTGGPAGGCLPEDKLDLPVDFDNLWEAGTIMGSGGLIVMDEDNCMVDVAKYFTKFLMEESCGKCTPCREGLRQLYNILLDISEGRGQEGDIELMEGLSEAISAGSICGLGQAAPIPLLSTIRYFRDEYEAHIKDAKCPAGVCKEMISYTIKDNCNGCGLCPRVCPTNAIAGEKKEIHIIDQSKCIKCGACYDSCKFDAIFKG